MLLPPFYNVSGDKKWGNSSTRILVRDCPLSNKSRREYEKLIKEKGIDYIEKKTENIVDRLKGTAQHSRTQERVPARAEFDMEIVVQLFDWDDEKQLIEKIKEGLLLVEKLIWVVPVVVGMGKSSFLR